VLWDRHERRLFAARDCFGQRELFYAVARDQVRIASQLQMLLVDRPALSEIDDEFAGNGWSPLLLEVNDDYARSLAALQIADVLIVNPLRDGMNLVAKEGPVLSERGVAVVLSREAGVADEFGADALLVNPYDVSSTATAMHEALLMDDAERRERSMKLAKIGITCVEVLRCRSPRKTNPS